MKQFETELKKLAACMAENKMEEYKEQLRGLLDDFPEKTDRIIAFTENELSVASEKIDGEINVIKVRMQLADKIKMLPLSYIADNYFHKSPHWLYQRINGNVVNGKPARFSDKEIELFNNALQDISRQIGSINVV